MILRIGVTVLVLSLVAACSASATTVSINTDSATAVLNALQNTSLSHEESLKIAAMPGNQGTLRKAHEFKVPVTTQSFADALFESAHGQKPKNAEEAYFLFDMVKSKADALKGLIRSINENPSEFQRPIKARIRQYSPVDKDLALQGYVVAGGDGGGYAFGATDFYLNVGIVDELIVARTTTAHELYHAVQGAFAAQRGAIDDLPDMPGMSESHQSCLKVQQLFGNLYEEGSALYVEDIDLLTQSHSEIGHRQEADLTDGMEHLQTAASLLEMSVVALTAHPSMPYDDVYDVDFYGHGVLYNIGFTMAKAIAEQDGPQALADYLQQPPAKFVLRYTQLPTYGKDKAHPTLGPQTLLAAKQQPHTCGE